MQAFFGRLTSLVKDQCFDQYLRMNLFMLKIQIYGNASFFPLPKVDTDTLGKIAETCDGRDSVSKVPGNQDELKNLVKRPTWSNLPETRVSGRMFMRPSLLR